MSETCDHLIDGVAVADPDCCPICDRREAFNARQARLGAIRIALAYAKEGISTSLDHAKRETRTGPEFRSLEDAHRGLDALLAAVELLAEEVAR